MKIVKTCRNIQHIHVVLNIYSIIKQDLTKCRDMYLETIYIHNFNIHLRSNLGLCCTYIPAVGIPVSFQMFKDPLFQIKHLLCIVLLSGFQSSPGALRCTWSIACRRCSNYMFVLNSTPGFNGLGKGNCKTREETFKFLDLVCLILEV